MKRNLAILVIVLVALGIYFFAKSDHNNPTSDSSTKHHLTVKGSDTEVQLVSNLSEEFSKQNKEADISVTGGGSAVGIASLLNGEIDIANSSRKMKDEELKIAKDKGLDVQEFVLSIDGLSIILHPSNSIARLSVEDLSKIYQGKVTNWKELGGSDAPIVLYGRQSTSGTYTFFRDSVVKGEYSSKMLNMEGNEAIVDGVKGDVNGIGYVGVGYVKDKDNNVRSDIKVISVSKDAASEAISPLNKDAVKNGQYPISRAIYQYLAHLPIKDSIQDKFLHFEVSNAGQALIEDAGFYSLNDTYMAANQELLNKIK